MSTSFSAEEHFRRGKTALEAGRHADSLQQFRAAHRLEPANPRYRSYFGLGLGLAERRFDTALQLCRSAAKEEFFNPDLYLNLARVHLAFGFKAEAIRYLRRGLMIDPRSETISAELRLLGMRRGPVLRFLRRGHSVNRWLGVLRRRLGRDRSGLAASLAG